MRRPVRTALLVFVGVALVALLAAAGGLVWLDSPAGREFVRSMIVARAKDRGIAATIDGMEGRLLDAITIRSLTLDDSDGRWLSAEKLRLAWRPSALLRGDLVIEAIEAEHMDVARQPILAPAPASEGGMSVMPRRIALDRLALARVDLGAPLAGQAAALRIEAQAAMGGNAATLQLDVDRLDASAQIKTRLAYDFHGDVLDLDLKASEARDGMIGGLLGLSGQPLVASLDGAGPLSQWRGHLHITAGDTDLVVLDGATEGPDVRTVSVSGRVGLTPMRASFPADLADILGSELGVVAKATITARSVSLDSATIGGRVAMLELSGATDHETGGWTAHAALVRVAPEVARHYGIAMAEGTLRFDAEGIDDRAKVSIAIDADNVASVGVEATDVHVRITAERPGATAPVSSTARLDAQLRTLPGGPALAPLLGPASLAMEGSEENGTFTVSKLSLIAGPLTVAGNGSYTDTSGRAVLAVDIRDQDKPAARLTGEARYEVSDGLAIEPLAVDLPRGRIAGAVRIDAAFQKLAASLDLTDADLAPLAPLLGANLAGRVSGRVAASGVLADPDAKIALKWSNGAIEGSALPPIKLDASVARLASAPNGDATVVADTPQGAVQLRTRFAQTGDTLDVARIEITGPGIAADGRLKLAMQSGLATGALKLDARDLAPALSIAGLNGSGRVRGDIALQPRGGVQSVKATVDLANIMVARDGATLLGVRRAAISADGALAGKSPVSARLAAEDIAASGVEIGRVAFTGRGTPAQIAFDVDVTAPAYRGLAMTMGGTLAARESTRTLRLARGNGRFAGKPFVIEPGMVATVAPGIYNVSKLKIGGEAFGDVGLEGGMRNGRLNAAFDIRDMPASILEDPESATRLRGKLGLTARVSGTVARPEGSMKLVGTGLGLRDEQGQPPVNAMIEGKLDQTAGTARVNVTGLSPTPLTGDARIGRLPRGFGFAAASPLTGRAAWQGPIDAITRFSPLVGQQVTGKLAMDVNVAGTLGAPSAAGAVVVTDGSLEAYATGTVLRFARLEIVGDQRQVTVRPFEAYDPTGGRVAAQAAVELDSVGDFPVAANLEFQRARLMNQDFVSAVVSGAMVAAGNMRKVAVEGRLTSDRVEVNTEAGLPPGITSISVQEVGPRPHHGSVSRKQKAAASSEAATDIALDMSLHLPGRVFVRGRGLDSEWEGDITVTGTASAPKIVGKLTSRRGDFDLAGKRFRIQPSTIDLQPAATGDVDASLAITARYEGKSITAIIEITGSATKPKLALKSVPEMPQDEILSRLLFNKSRASVTPGEAIQLAQAASSLSGGGGFDALGTLRKAMGVDVLRVASDEGGTGPSLETGKYVTENVYVGVRQGTDTTQTALSVEVDVFKNVAVETEMRPNGGNKLGAKYKIDY